MKLDELDFCPHLDNVRSRQKSDMSADINTNIVLSILWHFIRLFSSLKRARPGNEMLTEPFALRTNGPLRMAPISC